MAKPPVNEKIGDWTCERGGAASVYQTIKRGRHFYTRCDCCGLNQGVGAARQQQIFNETRFIDKSAIAVPNGVVVGDVVDVVPNAAGAITQDAPQKEPEPKPQAVSDFDPSEIEHDEPAPVVERGVMGRVFLPLGVLIAAIGVGIWTS